MSGSAYYLYWLTRNPQFVRKKAGFHGQVTQIINLSGRRRGFTDERVVGSSRQIRTMVSRTDADCGLPDKRGLRFTDRRSSDFPDTCHLNFPDASYLTKQPKSGITNSAQKTSAAETWSNLQTNWRFVVKKKYYDESGNRASTSY